MCDCRRIVNRRIDECVALTDTNGDIINASDGGIIYVDGIYHWYGLALRPFPADFGGRGGQASAIGVVMYASKNLQDWDYEGVILPCSDNPESELYAPMRFERPKIIYNDKTKKFILFCHYVKYPGDHGVAKGTAEAGIAVCDTINGTYNWLGYSRPIDDLGLVRDCTVFKDSDGSAYFIYDRETAEDNRCIHIVKLSEDYLEFTDEYKRIDEAFWREAPAVFYHDGYYYMITSDITGWNVNQAKYFRSKKLLGDWEDMGDPCVGDTAHTTFNSQGTYVFKVEEKDDLYIFMAERHNTKNLLKSSYIWLPVEFGESNTISVSYAKEWNF